METGKRETNPLQLVTTLPGMVSRRQTMAFGNWKARVSAAKILHAPEWPCPERAPGGTPSGPKLNKKGPWCLRGGPRKFCCPKCWTKSTWVLIGLPFCCVWPLVAPKRCPLGPKMGSSGPECVLQAGTKKWPCLGLDGPSVESREIFLTCKPQC